MHAEIVALLAWVAPAYLGGLLLSWGLEALLRPMPLAPWRRPTTALGVHAGLWTVIFALTLAVLWRPWCTAANVLALQGVFIIVNNAKHGALREPFVYPDLVFFTDALKHPRLYLPFLGWRAPLATASGYALALWGGLVFEPPLAFSGAGWQFLAALTLVGAGGVLGAWACARRLPRSMHFDARQDLQRLGQVAALWLYAGAERADTRALRAAAPFAKRPALARAGRDRETCPNLIVVQSESFFDARRVYPQLRNDLLQNYDRLRAEALQHGQLAIDAWGANTIRTEFAFLSGLSAAQLGVHRFHPYRTLARAGVATLASYLRNQGYRCVCIHPYHGSFYGRDRVLPLLGFDELIDIRAFACAKVQDTNAGPYVGDQVLGQYAQNLLAQDYAQPLYIHLITMENHGPLHWESVNDADAQRVLAQPLLPGCEDLVAYARHLANADAMFGGLRSALLKRTQPGVLCLFGDHVPIMPQVYHRLGEPNSDTDYLLWRSDRREAQIGQATRAGADQLAALCLRGLDG